jgi:hypothetical protein
MHIASRKNCCRTIETTSGRCYRRWSESLFELRPSRSLPHPPRLAATTQSSCPSNLEHHVSVGAQLAYITRGGRITLSQRVGPSVSLAFGHPLHSDGFLRCLGRPVDSDHWPWIYDSLMGSLFSCGQSDVARFGWFSDIDRFPLTIDMHRTSAASLGHLFLCDGILLALWLAVGYQSPRTWRFFD